MRERERGLVSSAKTSLDSSGSFCPVLFIKLVVLRLSAHTHGLSRLSCGSSMVAFVSLTRPFFFFSREGTCSGYILLAVSSVLISVIDCWLMSKHELLINFVQSLICFGKLCHI